MTSMSGCVDRWRTTTCAARWPPCRYHVLQTNRQLIRSHVHHHSRSVPKSCTYRHCAPRGPLTQCHATATSGSSNQNPDQPMASAKVDVGGAVEQINFPLLSSINQVITASIEFPLGLVLEDGPNGVYVAEVTPGGNADEAQVQVGDLLRGTTAAMMQMTYPTMNLMFGGVGRPKLVKILLPTSAQPFQKCMDAVRSNKDMDGTITLILERKVVMPPPSAVAVPTAEEPGSSATSSVFDASIFE